MIVIALWISVLVNDWTAEWATIASNVHKKNFDKNGVWGPVYSDQLPSALTNTLTESIALAGSFDLHLLHTPLILFNSSSY